MPVVNHDILRGLIEKLLLGRSGRDHVEVRRFVEAAGRRRGFELADCHL